MKKNLLFVLAVALSLSLCISSCGDQQSTPPYYGFFILEGREYIEIEEGEVLGEVWKSDIVDPPIAKDSQPVIVIWHPEAVFDYLQLLYVDEQYHIDYTIDSMGDDMYQVRPYDPLEPGYYCFIQGNPLAAFLSAWCFGYEVSATGSSANPTSSNSNVSTTSPGDLTADEILEVLATAIADNNNAQNAATAAAAEATIASANEKIATQEAAVTAEMEKKKKKQQMDIETKCERFIKNISNGDYSDLTPYANFDGCDLSNLDLFGLDLENASFRGAKLFNTITELILASCFSNLAIFEATLVLIFWMSS